MKITKVESRNAFKPRAFEITLENEADVLVLRAIAALDLTFPKMVRDFVLGRADIREASQGEEACTAAGRLCEALQEHRDTTGTLDLETTTRFSK